MHYLAVVNGGIDQNSCLARKLIGHNRSLNWLKRATWSSRILSKCVWFQYVSNCTSEMETGFQQILKLEKTVKSNWLGQEIHSK